MHKNMRSDISFFTTFTILILGLHQILKSFLEQWQNSTMWHSPDIEKFLVKIKMKVEWKILFSSVEKLRTHWRG